MKERINYIDNAKGIAMYAITIVHLTNSKLYESTFFSLFKVVIFYIIAGMIIGQKTQKDVTIMSMIKRRGLSLMFPYIFFSMFVILIHMFRLVLLGKNFVSTFKSDLFDFISLRGINTLWFLPTLFIGGIIFMLIMKRKWVLRFCIVLLPMVGVWSKWILTNFFPVIINSEDALTIISNVVLVIGKSAVAVWFMIVGYILFKSAIFCKYEKYIAIVSLLMTILISSFNPKINLNTLYLGENPVLFFLGGGVWKYCHNFNL